MNQRRHHLLIGVLATALAVATAAHAGNTASDRGAGVQPVASVEGITEYRLPNGLRVLLFPDPSKDTVTVNLTVFVGSRQEGYGETGMAHLLEHMLFKGTQKVKDPWKALQEHGASFNGSTWTDRTNYYETMPATAENLKWGIEFEADRMVNSRVDGSDLKSEFSVVRNEFEMGENDPGEILEERMFSSAFLWHNYGKSTIGSRSDIERVPIENLQAFYRKYYQPDNAMLVVAGKFEPKKALELVNGSFGRIPRPTRKLGASYTQEPVQDGERVVTLRRNGDMQVVGLMYHTVAGGDQDFVATEALVHALTTEPSGRLYQALVKTGMAARVWGSTYAWAEPGTLQLYAQVPVGKPVEPVKQKMISIVESFAKTPLTEAEVKRYRVETLKDWRLGFTKSDRIAVELSEWAAIGDWRMIFVYRDRVTELDGARVQKAAVAYLRPANRTLGMFVPTKTPERSPVPAARINVASLVNEYKGKGAIAQGEDFEASVANIEKRTTRGQLKNGMKTALLAKRTRGAAVRMEITLHYGTEKDLRGKHAAAELLGELMSRGTRKKSYQDLKDGFDALESQVSFSSGIEDGGNVTIAITTIRKNLGETLALVAEILKQPSFPRDQFEILRKEQLAGLEEQLSDPQAQGSVAFGRMLRDFDRSDVRYVPTTQESIARMKAVRLADIQTLYRGFLGASHGEVAVVGDFDPAELNPLLEQHLGSWRSPRLYKRLEMPFKEAAVAEKMIDTPDKENSMILVGHNVKMRDDDPDYAAMELANFMLGGSASARIWNRLRQKEGLSYGAGSGFKADAQDKYGYFVGYAICAPQNVPKAMKAMLEEITAIVDKGVTQDELAKAKASWRKDFDRDLSSDGHVLGQLNADLFIGRTMAFDQKVADAVAKLTVADLNRVLKKWVRPQALIKVMAGDQKKQNGGGAAGAGGGR